MTHYPQMPNKAVRELLGRSHFCLLPTLADTFGFSMIEAMAEHTPVIGSRLAAVPEVIAPGFNGYLLHIETTELGEWQNPGYWERGTTAYETQFRDTTEHLAEQMVSLFQTLIGQTDTLKELRRNARWSAEHFFAAGPAAQAWDSLYERAAAEDLTTLPICDPVLDASPPEYAATRTPQAA